jgi:hypothetical protein
VDSISSHGNAIQGEHGLGETVRKVDRLTVLGGIGGTGGNGDLAGKLIAMSEQLKAATGLDIVGAVRKRVSAGHPTPAPVRLGT